MVKLFRWRVRKAISMIPRSPVIRVRAAGRTIAVPRDGGTAASSTAVDIDGGSVGQSRTHSGAAVGGAAIAAPALGIARSSTTLGSGATLPQGESEWY